VTYNHVDDEGLHITVKGVCGNELDCRGHAWICYRDHMHRHTVKGVTDKPLCLWNKLVRPRCSTYQELDR
jgi:hypothetical protein